MFAVEASARSVSCSICKAVDMDSCTVDMALLYIWDESGSEKLVSHIDAHTLRNTYR